MSNKKTTLYISMSLDGYISTLEDEISFLSMVEKEGEDYGYNSFTETVDTYIIGRKTYEVVKNLLNGNFPQAKQYNCYVITRQKIESSEVTFYNGDLKTLITKLKQEAGKNIYCDGGGQIVQLLLKDYLIDEIIVSIIPVLLGNGKKLFPAEFPLQKLTLKKSTPYSTGLVQLHYAVNTK